jgi:hypothetical protein
MLVHNKHLLFNMHGMNIKIKTVDNDSVKPDHENKSLCYFAHYTQPVNGTTTLLSSFLNIQSVPLATEPGISLIILPLMRLLQ